MSAWLTVVGIGQEGWSGMGRAARRALCEADVIYGARRQLALLPPRLAAQRLAWPRPFSVEPVLARRGQPVCVLASGDPMLFGVGASLARHVAARELRVIPAPSSLSLAAARLGWPLHEVTCLSLAGRPLALLNARLHAGARLLVLSADGATPLHIAALLRARRFGPTRMWVFEALGATDERCLDGQADSWPEARVAPLNVVALECRPAADPVRLPLTPGLPDNAYRHDGQLTKRDMRALTLARLAPEPGELLWDVGAGCGSIGIEWMRAHASCRAIAVEANEARRALIEHNRDALGVPGLELVAGCAPAALRGLPPPDAVFVGGGVSTPGLLEQCWGDLRVGGRLVANAVTLQGEASLLAWRARHGGELIRVALGAARPLGAFDSWRPALPITLLCVGKA